MLAFFNPRWALMSTTIFVFNFLNPSIAFAQETAQEPLSSVTETESSVDNQGYFLSDGAPVNIDRLGIQISPPNGWEVFTNNPNLSVIMTEIVEEDPKAKKDYSKPTFKRNITVAATHKATPIDETRAAELKQEMTETFSKDASVSDFQVIEHKFFDYKAKNDGLLIFTALNIGEFPMMQMHILVSGMERQFLLTYTDLADRFQQQELFDQAWNSMASIEVTGQAPKRWEDVIRYGAIGGGIFLLLMIISMLRFRSARRDYMAEAETVYEDTSFDDKELMATMHGGWKIEDQDIEDEMGFHSEWASNF